MQVRDSSVYSVVTRPTKTRLWPRFSLACILLLALGSHGYSQHRGADAPASCDRRGIGSGHPSRVSCLVEEMERGKSSPTSSFEGKWGLLGQLIGHSFMNSQATVRLDFVRDGDDIVRRMYFPATRDSIEIRITYVSEGRALWGKHPIGVLPDRVQFAAASWRLSSNGDLEESGESHETYRRVTAADIADMDQATAGHRRAQRSRDADLEARQEAASRAAAQTMLNAIAAIASSSGGSNGSQAPSGRSVQTEDRGSSDSVNSPGVAPHRGRCRTQEMACNPGAPGSCEQMQALPLC